MNERIGPIALQLTSHFLAVLIPVVLAGCAGPQSKSAAVLVSAEPIQLCVASLDPTSEPVSTGAAASLHAARNQWTSFVVSVRLPAPTGYRLLLHPLANGGSAIPVTSLRAYQVLEMPVSTDQAGYVRHTGQDARVRRMPRALIPLAMDRTGAIDLATLHNPDHPGDARSHAGGPGSAPAMIWIDVHVPKGTAPADYASSVEVLGDSQKIHQSLAVALTVDPFDLPDERHLLMVGNLNWDRLEKLYPAEFELVTPSWINRREARYAQTVRTLDQLVSLAQENRANLVVPALTPIVKWPAGDGPQVDWRDFDSIVSPWFSGMAFGDNVGAGFWPLPRAQMLDRFDRPSQLAFFTAAAAHFAERGWLSITAADPIGGEPIRSADGSDGSTPAAPEGSFANAELSAEAAELLKIDPPLRVRLPLEDMQIQLADAAHPAGVDPASASRLLAAAGSLVSASSHRAWAGDPPRRWLRTDLANLVPYFGAGGDEHDVRVWAWLAFLRHLDSYGARHVFEQNYIQWNSTLPLDNEAQQPAPPDELTWFYPGSWFGVDEPVATVQLKWLRHAEQDYEYLLLAQDRGEAINTLQLARLIAKPVALEPGQMPDAAYALMTRASSAQAWNDAQRLLTDTILLHAGGATPDPARQQELYIRTLYLSAPQERPLLLARGGQWQWSDRQGIAGADAGSAAVDSDRVHRAPGRWVDLNFALDIYNASETTPDQNHVRWAAAPPGWTIAPQGQDVPRLQTYHVLQTILREQFNLDQITSAAREPIEVRFQNGHDNVESPLKFVMPVAASDWREGRLAIDGQLDDWSPTDQIQAGPLVRMLNRPAIQQQQLQRAATDSAIFTAWGRENFYVGFSLDGLAHKAEAARNFVDYQDRRAWGEDLCELLIQPIDADNRPGDVLHIVAKPNGSVWVERKETGGGQTTWTALPTIRYAATTPRSAWHGELAIPWSLLIAPGKPVPSLLRFNFSQHKSSTGESATWAGPVDFGRDDNFMGLIYLRPPQGHGVADIVRHEPP